jgi:hypothetical protein
MAEFKSNWFVRPTNGRFFEHVYPPGATARFSGIYRCRMCGHEAAVGNEKKLPPQDSHTHKERGSPIEWQLIVRTSFVPDRRASPRKGDRWPAP